MISKIGNACISKAGSTRSRFEMIVKTNTKRPIERKRMNGETSAKNASISIFFAIFASYMKTPC